LVYKLQLADRIFILPEGVFSPQLFNSYRTTRLTRGFGIQKDSRLKRLPEMVMRCQTFNAPFRGYGRNSPF
ncbi:hypothetical protein, partial [Oscillibacter sp. MSJ-31]|uniref:hypothetical protein n=1 Tax=Oscillibacter sp. MSJ-31 TaxID=2841526 RepID=UPI001C11BECE